MKLAPCDHDECSIMECSKTKEKSGFEQSLEGPQDWPPKMFKVTISVPPSYMLETIKELVGEAGALKE